MASSDLEQRFLYLEKRCDQLEDFCRSLLEKLAINDPSLLEKVTTSRHLSVPVLQPIQKHLPKQTSQLSCTIEQPTEISKQTTPAQIPKQPIPAPVKQIVSNPTTKSLISSRIGQLQGNKPQEKVFSPGTAEASKLNGVTKVKEIAEQLEKMLAQLDKYRPTDKLQFVQNAKPTKKDTFSSNINHSLIFQVKDPDNNSKTNRPQFLSEFGFILDLIMREMWEQAQQALEAFEKKRSELKQDPKLQFQLHTAWLALWIHQAVKIFDSNNPMFLTLVEKIEILLQKLTKKPFEEFSHMWAFHTLYFNLSMFQCHLKLESLSVDAKPHALRAALHYRALKQLEPAEKTKVAMMVAQICGLFGVVLNDEELLAVTVTIFEDIDTTNLSSELIMIYGAALRAKGVIHMDRGEHDTVKQLFQKALNLPSQ